MESPDTVHGIDGVWDVAFAGLVKNPGSLWAFVMVHAYYSGIKLGPQVKTLRTAPE